MNTTETKIKNSSFHEEKIMCPQCYSMQRAIVIHKPIIEYKHTCTVCNEEIGLDRWKFYSSERSSLDY